MKLPRAILFDLDDTILIAFGPAQSQWQRTISAFAKTGADDYVTKPFEPRELLARVKSVMRRGAPGRDVPARRIAAILVADVAGYSRLVGEDEEGTLARLRRLRRELIDPEIAPRDRR
jgi:DNA-binding response OmpR family regulator